MSQVKIQGNASGTGIFTIASPNSNNNRTMTLSDTDGTIFISPGNGVQVQTSSGPAARTITAGTGISVTNGDGASGNPTITNTGVTSVNGNTGAVTISSGAPAALDVGSYIIGRPNNTNNYNAGDTIAGSSLYQAPPGSQYDGSFSDGGTVVGSGTWRCMSRNFQKVFAGPTYVGLMGLWCRVS